MKIRSLFKRKKELININIPEIPITKRNPNVMDEEIYMEKTEFTENDYSVSSYKNNESLLDKISEILETFEKNNSSLLHNFFFFKLFSKVASKDKKFNVLMIETDKLINRIKKSYEEYKKRYDVLKYLNNLECSELQDLFKKVNELTDFLKEIESRVNHISKTYYLDLKMASYSISKEKNYLELDKLNRNVNTFLDNYKSIQEAHDHIYYYSGELIVNTVKALVECFRKSNNPMYIKTYSYNYFLPSEVIISFSYSEWVNLFNKMRYVMRTTNNIELFDYLNFNKYYSELEVRYLIILIYNETLSKTNVKVRGSL